MYDYQEIHAMMYDAHALGVGGDAEFYVDEAQRSGGPVLELGCGTGRILIPTAEAGIDIVGLDASPAMLAVARGKVAALDPGVRTRIELLEGDMSRFSLDRTFKLITVPYRAFLHLMTPESQRQALACIWEHLDEGGRLILNIFDPRLDLMEREDGTPRRGNTFVHPVTGRRVVFYDSSRRDPQWQTIDVSFIFEELDDRGEVISKSYSLLTLRWIYRYEMQYLLELSGFKIDALYGDFQRGPFRYGGEQIWVASKKDTGR